MIEESYVSFETAKLLHEKDFNEFCFSSYLEDGRASFAEVETRYAYPEIARPTQQMAMRWLREEHSLDIITFHEKLPNDCYWCRIETYPYTEFEQEPVHKTYEEACEAAIKYCLINLVKANAEG